ncbi:MAG: molybdenum cofactor guanylyltransferase MobA [Paracoccaceae bacterium]
MTQAGEKNAQVAGVILAGGLARRMGGGDKGLLMLGDRPVIGHVIARLAPQLGALAINANDDPSRFAPLGLPVIADTVPDRPGPLAGLLAGMIWAHASGFGSVLVVAGDTPFVPPDLVARLGQPGPVLARSPDPDGTPRLHPTIGLWPVAMAPILTEALAKGERRIGAWALGQGARIVDFNDTPDPFFNINTPQDLALARMRLAGGSATP